MSQLKGNKLTPLLVVGSLIILGAIYFSGDEEEAQKTTKKQVSTVSDGKEKIETPAEEVQRLSGQVVALEEKLSNVSVKPEEIAQSVTENVLSKLQSEKGVDGNEDPRSSEEIEAAINAAVSEKLNKLLENEGFDAGNAPDVDRENFDSGGRETTDTEERFAYAFGGSTDTSSASVAGNNGKVKWEYPAGYQKTEEGIIDRATGAITGFGRDTGESFNDTKGTLEEELKATPVMTIPPDSRIYDVLAETALVGRIPKGGENRAPWSFSATLSRYTSLANGHSLPEIAEARVSGIAIGDLAGECVKGYVTSLTFIFPDGRIAHSKGTLQEPIAKIADEYGNPCIPGYHVDNWNEVVAAQGTMSGLASIAESIQQRQQTVNSSATQQSLSLTGSATKAAAGAFASGGLDKTAEMMAERYESFYSFVYIEPGETITLLIEKPISIDYDPKSRKVRYETDLQFSYN